MLDNAAKFSDDRSAITVTVGHDEERAWVAVSDEGVGIPEDEQGRIFDRFYQVDSSLTRKAYGSGIGLNLAQGMARLHGGDVIVDSEVGKGSTFTLWLPKDRPWRSEAAGSRSA